MTPSEPARIAQVLAYHERTRHAPGRYAASLGYLDWDTQPDPFRRYEGAPIEELQEPPELSAPSYGALWASPEPRPFDLLAVSDLLYHSLALSAWKRAGRSRWSLRVNPSSGNLHPTEAYLLLAPDGAPRLTHYAPFLHALERRRELDRDAWQDLTRELGAPLLIGLTSIPWRESWKYGERAFRYTQHDVGHALAALVIAARILGWGCALIEGLADAELAAVLGVADQLGPEAERPDLLLAVGPGVACGLRPAPASLHRLAVGPLAGSPNALSHEHHDWPIIDEVAELSQHEVGPARSPLALTHGTPAARLARELPARRIVRQRRSAVDMDATTATSHEQFIDILAVLEPAASAWLFDVLPTCAVHPLFFVHRVIGLEPGLYLLPRGPGAAERLGPLLDPELEREPVATLGESALLRLASGDARGLVQHVSCGQAIAADGAFAVAMLAELEPALTARGPAAYRELHWEAGALGQLLYLEAEAIGLRGTGIGCFLDPEVHRVLGCDGRRLATLYHFTVGGAREDARIEVEPAYQHRSQRP